MDILLRMAIRNLWRYKQRTMLTGLGMFTGSLMLILSSSFNGGMQSGFNIGAMETLTGHILIHAPTSQTYDPMARTIFTWPGIPQEQQVEAIVRQQPEVRLVTPRNRATAIVISDVKSTVAEMIGVDPDLEPIASPRIAILQGTYLNSERPGGILLPEGMAKSLKVGVGDRVLVMYKEADLPPSTVTLQVRGIYTAPGMTSFIFNRVLVELKPMQRLTNVHGQIQELAVLIDKPDKAVQVAAALRQKLTDAGIPLRVDAWQDVFVVVQSILSLVRTMTSFMNGAVFVIVIVITLNTMLMSALERTREMGVLKAIGYRAYHLIGLLLLEGALIAALAGGLGCALGGGIALWLSRVGIPANNTAVELLFGGKYLYLVLSPTTLLVSYGLVIGTSVVAALYPAVMASMCDPIEALQYV